MPCKRRAVQMLCVMALVGAADAEQANAGARVRRTDQEGDIVVADVEYQFLDGTSLPLQEDQWIDTQQGAIHGMPCEAAVGKFVGAEVGGVDFAEAALFAADGRTNCFDDVCFRHLNLAVWLYF
mgnify:CR=1 FL=1